MAKCSSIIKLYSFLFVLLIIGGNLAAQTKPHILVGTYTNGGSYGIYSYTYNPINNQAYLQDSVQYSNPSFLTLTSDGKHLLAVSEEKEGHVGLFSYDRPTGKISLVNEVLAMGAHPCHVSLSPGNSNVYVSNYSSGNFVVMPLLSTGQGDRAIHEAKQNFIYKGKGVDTARQKSSHTHMALPTSDGHFVLVTNLGTDELYVYRSLKKPPRLILTSTIKATPGAGPRHMSFSPDERYLYMMEEFTGYVSVYSFKDGKLKPLQRIAAMPHFDKGRPDGADIHVSPDGKNLYCTTRGNYNAISTFAINKANGKLTYITHQSVMGKRPRNFLISPMGHNVLVANQGSNEIVCFYRNQETGLLTDTGERIKVPNPTCIVWGN